MNPTTPSQPQQPYGAPPAGGAPAPGGHYPYGAGSNTGSMGVPFGQPGQVGVGAPMGQLSSATPPIVPGQPYLGAAPPPIPGQPLGLTNDMPMVPPVQPSIDVKNEVVEKLRAANNVLVTVTTNPSVDQLAAAIGITLVLNKLDKHATAVYSGETPSTLEFLQPEKTIEKNTDSLRDFIIALDKAKADKLRYKVEDTFVKIFITPYHTSLSENDLEFSQGDFNVDVILALGVHRREELDQAITAHGRILHDAVTVSINNNEPSDLGTINWFQADASSLCEMLVNLVEPLQGDKTILDEQVATSFLTGVVAETERFSNPKTTPHTMNIAATLMKAGANQQLVSSKLEVATVPKAHESAKLQSQSSDPNAPPAPIPAKSDDGSLAIAHDPAKEAEKPAAGKTLEDLEKENAADDEEGDSNLAKIHIDEEGRMVAADAAKPADKPISSNMVLQPPTLGGPMSAIERPDTGAGQPAVDMPPEDASSLQHAKTVSPLSDEEKQHTLAEIEEAVHSSHQTATDDSVDADAARQAVEQAGAAVDNPNPEPIQALNAQPIDLNPEDTQPTPTTTEEAFPAQIVGPDTGLPVDPTAAAADPTAPPPVPPPMMPPQ